MNFLVKLEDLANRGLLWLGAKLMVLWLKICPAFLLRGWEKCAHGCAQFRDYCKSLPLKGKDLWGRRQALVSDYQGVFTQALEAGRKAFAASKQHSPLKAVWMALTTPFSFLFQWAASLKPTHFVILFVFTTASVLSTLGIVIESRKIISHEDQISRAPASAEADTYQRPEYHKKNERELTFNNVKIPVYVTGANELRSLIIDFSVVTSNRATKAWLESREFQMRDHLVHTLEPVLPSFPMSDEGRAMITEKLQQEVNHFIEKHQVEGVVKETRLIYILAH
jgi:flagellar basal body-associated protein FliL